MTWPSKRCAVFLHWSHPQRGSPCCDRASIGRRRAGRELPLLPRQIDWVSAAGNYVELRAGGSNDHPPFLDRGHGERAGTARLRPDSPVVAGLAGSASRRSARRTSFFTTARISRSASATGPRSPPEFRPFVTPASPTRPEQLFRASMEVRMLRFGLALLLVCGSVEAFAQVAHRRRLAAQGQQAAGIAAWRGNGIWRRPDFGWGSAAHDHHPARGQHGQAPGNLHTQAVSCGSLEPLPADRIVGSRRTRPALGHGPGARRAGRNRRQRRPRLQRARLRHRGSPLSRSIRPGRPASVGRSATASSFTEAAWDRRPRRWSPKARRSPESSFRAAAPTTYLERMINFDRLYLERSGKYRPDQIHDEMIRRIAFHSSYLLGKKTPEQIAPSGRTSPVSGRISAEEPKRRRTTAGPMPGTGRPPKRISSPPGRRSRRR